MIVGSFVKRVWRDKEASEEKTSWNDRGQCDIECGGSLRVL